MKLTSYIFGDVFIFQNAEYIFLAATTDEIYAAKILTPELTKKIEAQSVRAEQNGLPAKNRALVYCYVLLKSGDFKQRAAFLGKTDFPFDMVTNKLVKTLCKEDLLAIQTEILQSRATNEKLKEQIKGLTIT